MARDVMILMGTNPFRWPLEGMDPENFFETFLGSEMATNEKVPLPMTRVMDLPPIKISKYECHLKNRYIDNFMYISIRYSVYLIFRAHPFQWPSPPPTFLKQPFVPKRA
jgi:hypothetical protein